MLHPQPSFMLSKEIGYSRVICETDSTLSIELISRVVVKSCHCYYSVPSAILLGSLFQAYFETRKLLCRLVDERRSSITVTFQLFCFMPSCDAPMQLPMQWELCSLDLSFLSVTLHTNKKELYFVDLFVETFSLDSITCW